MNKRERLTDLKGMKWSFLLLFLSFVGCSSPPPTTATNAALVWNPWNNSLTAGEPISASGNTGFYVQPYPGSSLTSVVMWLLVNYSGSYTFSLAATDSTHGTAIGTASSGSVSIVNDSSYHPVTFTYGSGDSISKGDNIAFVISVPSLPSGTASADFCPQGNSAANVNLVLTVNGNPQSTGAAVVVNGGS